MKYNKSNIMKKAWDKYKTFKANNKDSESVKFGAFLKIAWELAKKTLRSSKKIVEVAEWIVRKNLHKSLYDQVKYEYDFQATVEKETEKAFLVSFGPIPMWCPKSQATVL